MPHTNRSQISERVYHVRTATGVLNCKNGTDVVPLSTVNAC